MYEHCIYCSHRLGTNRVLQTFAVGSTVAFDAAKGRLWAVCPRCRRWNLAPIETRWEAVEEAAALFRTAQSRTQRGQIAIAVPASRFQLIQVGGSAAEELAAWRYGDVLTSRWRRTKAVSVAVVGAGIGWSALGLPGLWGTPLAFYWAYAMSRGFVADRQRVGTATDGGTGGAHTVLLRRHNLIHSRVSFSHSASLSISLPLGKEIARDASRELHLEGASARDVLRSAMVFANRTGARASVLRAALDRVAEVGDLDGLSSKLAGTTWDLGIRHSAASVLIEAIHLRKQLNSSHREDDSKSGLRYPVLDPVTSVALEMLLNEELEQKALAGDLDELQRAWREAEEIAAIADAL